MNVFNKILNDKKRARGIESKIKESTEQKAISTKASKLKQEFDLSDDEAKFMAKRELKMEKRSKTIKNLSSGLGNVLGGLDVDVPSKRSVDNAKRANGAGKRKGKKGNGSGKKKKMDPLNIGIPELDLSDLKF